MSETVDYKLSDINEQWAAVHKATLVFVCVEGQVLLIRKKRGLGAGKINGPGGKLDKNETLDQCAVREVQEELAIQIDQLQAGGRLRFQFVDGYSIDVSVYLAFDYAGTPTETDEAIPLWFAQKNIPYDEMWADDRIWLPRVLSGEAVQGRFIFDGDAIVDHEVSFTPSRSSPSITPA